MCMCLARVWVGGVGVEDWVWALLILEEYGESVVCVLVAVVWGEWVGGLGGVMLCVCCESGFFVLMAGPGICILC